jgi:hypothetical protein
MPITQFVTIDGRDVSPWVLGVDIDVLIPATNESFVQQCDLTLSNVNGRFDGMISAPGFGDTINSQSKIVVVLYSIEYSRSLEDPDVYVTLAFTGLAQKVDQGYTTVKVNAGTTDMNASGYLTNDIHKHYGQPTGPAIRDVLAMYKLPAGTISIPTGMEKREWEFMRDQSGKGVLDFLSDWDGQETYVDEHGKLNHVPPGVAGTNPDYTGRMKVPQQSESAVGLCTKVIVRGGSFINAKDPGAELLPSDAIGYETTQSDMATILNNENGEGGADAAADMIKNYGWIRAPTFFFPDCTTNEECRKRAIRLLARYITYWKRTVPTVVGRSPKLRSKIQYRYPRLLDMAWQLSPWFTGRVVRCRTNFGPKVGWTCMIEVQPFVLNDENAAKIYGKSELGQ